MERAPTLVSDSNSVLSPPTLKEIQLNTRDEASKPERDLNQIDLELYLYEWIQRVSQKALQALNQSEAPSPDQKFKITEHLKSLPLEYSNARSTETNHIKPFD